MRARITDDMFRNKKKLVCSLWVYSFGQRLMHRKVPTHTTHTQRHRRKHTDRQIHTHLLNFSILFSSFLKPWIQIVVFLSTMASSGLLKKNQGFKYKELVSWSRIKMTCSVVKKIPCALCGFICFCRLTFWSILNHVEDYIQHGRSSRKCSLPPPFLSLHQYTLAISVRTWSAWWTTFRSLRPGVVFRWIQQRRNWW